MAVVPFTVTKRRKQAVAGGGHRSNPNVGQVRVSFVSPDEAKRMVADATRKR